MNARKQRLAHAVKTSRDTREVVIEAGAIARVSEVFNRHFSGYVAVIVADAGTFSVAGKRAHHALKRSMRMPEIERLFDDPAIRDKALLESSAKYISRDALADELQKVKEVWPTLREKLKSYLLTPVEFKQRLTAAGASSEPEQIGIERSRLVRSHRLAYYIRRRFTVLDLAVRCDLLETLLHA